MKLLLATVLIIGCAFAADRSVLIERFTNSG